jgi:hypothetical protein
MLSELLVGHFYLFIYFMLPASFKNKIKTAAAQAKLGLS